MGCPEGERTGVLQEELTFLGKEETEPREVDLLLVGLDLGEVGSVSEVERQRLGHAVLGVETPVEVRVRVSFPLPTDLREGRRGERLDLQVSTLAADLDSTQRPGHRDSVDPIPSGQGSPVTVFGLATNPPDHVQTPLLDPAVGKPQGLERNHELGNPRFPVHANPHIPDTVPVPVHAEPVVGDLGIPLRTGRVGPEEEPGTFVFERIEGDPEPILVLPVEIFVEFR